MLIVPSFLNWAYRFKKRVFCHLRIFTLEIRRCLYTVYLMFITNNKIIFFLICDWLFFPLFCIFIRYYVLFRPLLNYVQCCLKTIHFIYSSITAFFMSVFSNLIKIPEIFVFYQRSQLRKKVGMWFYCIYLNVSSNSFPSFKSCIK